MIKHYDSISALREDYIANGRPMGGSGLGWYGGEDKATTLRLSETGDATLVAEAERIMGEMQHTIEVPRRQVFRAVAGGWPSVPDAIAGLPLSMRRLGDNNDEFAPIAIYADTSCSAGIDSRTMRSRGCTILALVMELAKIRPISLYQVTTMGTGKGHGGYSRWGYGEAATPPDYEAGEVILSARINTTPLDLATAAYVLTSTGFSRRLTYDTTMGYGGNGEWPTRYKKLGKDAYAEYITNTLGINPKMTLYIEAPHIDDELVRNPTKWLNKQIKRFTAKAQEDEYV